MNEQEIAWLEHVKKQKESGWNIKTYCHQASLNYDQFRYWRKKYRIDGSVAVSQCIPVRIKSEIEKSIVLCTLILKDGRRLEFHDAVLVKTFLRECA